MLCHQKWDSAVWHALGVGSLVSAHGGWEGEGEVCALTEAASGYEASTSPHMSHS